MKKRLYIYSLMIIYIMTLISFIGYKIENKEINQNSQLENQIYFKDKNFETKVREITGIKSEVITIDDVKDIKEFSTEDLYNDITPIKYFTSLEKLSIGTRGNKDLELLSELNNLESLHISGYNIINFKALNKLSNLRELEINLLREDMDIKDLVGNTQLEKLTFNNCTGLNSLDGIDGIKGLKDLTIRYSDSIKNIETIKNCNNLENIELVHCNSINNIEVLGTMQNLKNIKLEYCMNLQNINALYSLENTNYVVYECSCKDIKVINN